MNTNLFKEAIAEADAIKKMAIENAKASLNEAFDSKVKAMLAARLSEEADDLEEEYEEEDEAAELDEKKHEEEAEEKDEAAGLEEKKEEEAEDEDEAYGGKEEEEADEAFDLDAILAELEKGDDSEEVMEKKEVEDEPKEDESEEEESEEEESVDEEIDIASLLAEMADEEDHEEKDEASVNEDVSIAQDLVTALAGMGAITAGSVALEKLVNLLPEKTQEILLRVAKAAAGARGLGEEKEEVEELQEIKRQAAELTQKVNETNLINAKLLYLNKILRKYNLTEQQKIKVISAFDKAETAKEAKIVHESLDHAFSVKNDNVKTGLKESIGFASSAAGTSTKRVITESVISDVDKQVNRWQKLAGIIK